MDGVYSNVFFFLVEVDNYEHTYLDMIDTVTVLHVRCLLTIITDKSYKVSVGMYN